MCRPDPTRILIIKNYLGAWMAARPLRIEYPGAYYHITSRGNEQKEIFKNNNDPKNGS